MATRTPLADHSVLDATQCTLDHARADVRLEQRDGRFTAQRGVRRPEPGLGLLGITEGLDGTNDSAHHAQQTIRFDHREGLLPFPAAVERAARNDELVELIGREQAARDDLGRGLGRQSIHGRGGEVELGLDIGFEDPLTAEGLGYGPAFSRCIQIPCRALRVAPATGTTWSTPWTMA